jgi:hypothetical protein
LRTHFRTRKDWEKDKTLPTCMKVLYVLKYCSHPVGGRTGVKVSIVRYIYTLIANAGTLCLLVSSSDHLHLPLSVRVASDSSSVIGYEKASRLSHSRKTIRGSLHRQKRSYCVEQRSLQLETGVPTHLSRDARNAAVARID